MKGATLLVRRSITQGVEGSDGWFFCSRPDETVGRGVGRGNYPPAEAVKGFGRLGFLEPRWAAEAYPIATF